MRTLLLAMVLLLSSRGFAQWDPHADWIFRNEQIVTVDSAFTLAESLAVKDVRRPSSNYSSSSRSASADSMHRSW